MVEIGNLLLDYSREDHLCYRKVSRENAQQRTDQSSDEPVHDQGRETGNRLRQPADQKDRQQRRQQGQNHVLQQHQPFTCVPNRRLIRLFDHRYILIFYNLLIFNKIFLSYLPC